MDILDTNGYPIFEVEVGDLKECAEQPVDGRMNLKGVTLNFVDLSGADLTRQNLDNASLDGVNLDGANLRGASLCGAGLECASLYGVSFTQEQLDSLATPLTDDQLSQIIIPEKITKKS